MIENVRVLNRNGAMKYHAGQEAFIIGAPDPGPSADPIFRAGWTDELIDHEEVVHGIFFR